MLVAPVGNQETHALKTTLALLIPIAALAAALPTFAKEGDDPPAVAKALAKLRSAETYDSEYVGEAGEKSDTYRAYEVLRDEASAKRLVALTDDRSPVVRCYAVRALAEARRAGLTRRRGMGRAWRPPAGRVLPP